MFSGIVESLGTITQKNQHQKGMIWSIAWDEASSLQIGDSISVNGVCLTVTKQEKNNFTVDLVPETLQKTSMETYQVGDHVNLERSLNYHDLIMGHMVQGHVDEALPIINWVSQHMQMLLTLPRSNDGIHWLVQKGYVAVDGMSLTVANLSDHSFDIAIIPHTKNITIAKDYTIGRKVNIEYDMMGKYITQYMDHYTMDHPIKQNTHSNINNKI